MATGSKGGRTYSDPSYGSVKTMQFSFVGSAGTRPTAIVSTIVPMNPITVIDWQMVCTAVGTGGSSQWVLAATSAVGTQAFGTIAWAGTHAANATIEGTATEAIVSKGGALHLYSILSTADPALFYTTRVSYRETFIENDS